MYVEHIVLFIKAFSSVAFELRVSGSFLTYMSIIGKLDNQGDLPPHFDEKDSITALIHLGKSLKGGAAQYYNGDTISNKGSIKAQIPFRYGQI